jgi:hypothetical protein
MHKDHISAYINIRKEELIMERKIEKAEVIIYGNAVSIARFDAWQTLFNLTSSQPHLYLSTC